MNSRRCLNRTFFIPVLVVLLLSLASHVSAAGRSVAGLLVGYDFSETEGAQIHDASGNKSPLLLRINNPKGVQHSKKGLLIKNNAKLVSDGPARAVNVEIKESGEITVEAWIRPASKNQEGPARIITISKNGSERNFTLGQDGGRYDARLRTTKTSGNGIPSISAGGLKPELTHVVYTRSRNGRARLYLNGKKASDGNVAGNMSNWNTGYSLALGDEFSGDRQWKGEYRMVALFSRALSEAEVMAHYSAGPDAGVADGSTIAGVSKDEQFFEMKVAPLLAKHCVECHDPSTREGRLDISTKEGAFGGKRKGKFIVPGKSLESLVWEAVATDEMPEDKEPLSDEEKAILKKWIDSGAAWTLDRIDPAIYAHDHVVAENWIQRLTIDEYIATVKQATGVDIEKEARALLPRDLRADGFSNTAYNLSVDLKHVGAYSQLAETIVGRMDVLAFAKRFHGSRKLIDKDNRALIERMGEWLLRGPIVEDELALYRGVATSVASAGGDFKEATSLIIEAMLQSPRFIYRMEKQRGYGESWPVSPHEMASRISYTVWGSAPDRELLKAANDGELMSDNGIAKQVDRMLGDSKAVERSLQFFGEWLNLGRLKNLNPNPARFPDWNSALAEEMRRESLAFFEEVIWKQKRPMADLFNAQVSFMTPALAKHYGLIPAGEGFARYDLEPIASRGGLLTHGSVLTMGGDDASTVTRGLFVLHDVLRGIVSDPPPGLDTTPVPSSPGRSQRGIAEERIANESCGGCHKKFEPLAFGLERFDGLGSYLEKDVYGNSLRHDGEILFPGDAKPTKYQTAGELMNLLAGSDRVKETITWKMTQFALGRPLVPTDLRQLKQIHEAAQEGGGTYAAVVRAILMSDLMRTTRGHHAD